MYYFVTVILYLYELIQICRDSVSVSEDRVSSEYEREVWMDPVAVML